MRCSILSDFAGEPLAGTAATATAWLCLEQPGPWGRDALLESHLDPELGAELQRRAAGTGVRILLIRRPGKHADTHTPSTRRLYLASTKPGASWLEQADLTAPEEALELDFEALGAGRSTAFGTPVADPLLLICTNSKRDVCCALYGRPIATALNLWECTHTGGHRFAPTGVLLPTGHLYGRIDHQLAHRVVTEGIVADRCRGRSCFTPRGQVAEVAVREQIGETRDVLTVVAETADSATVRHDDGREWRVALTKQPVPPRPASCGKSPDIAIALVATAIDQLVKVYR
ncbi:sucrase ferredoxin [Lentzea sp. NBC_00516]|uniref:sucrase ferredoxin n=1 Tax=Lentzea sp. NBC_00516 TaxID=2903582 RepID=UPI002E8075F6|nr:sucrase ferredoxin [Lentzea sp. NBC_00516]WUD27000.1 sucrase ferredoxin [Lentzea sp. NBC_00516]